MERDKRLADRPKLHQPLTPSDVSDRVELDQGRGVGSLPHAPSTFIRNNMATHFDNLSQLPLLSEDNIESGKLNLQRLVEAQMALASGKLPSSDQLASIVQKLLKSAALQPKLGSRIAGKVGGGQLSAKGEEMVAAARGVLEALVRVGMEKNGDDKVCTLILLRDSSEAVSCTDHETESTRSSASSTRPRRLPSMLMSMLVSSDKALRQRCSTD